MLNLVDDVMWDLAVLSYTEHIVSLDGGGIPASIKDKVLPNKIFRMFEENFAFPPNLSRRDNVNFPFPYSGFENSERKKILCP